MSIIFISSIRRDTIRESDLVYILVYLSSIGVKKTSAGVNIGLIEAYIRGKEDIPSIY